eukprot:871666-Amphidinium_carterae.3
MNYYDTYGAQNNCHLALRIDGWSQVGAFAMRCRKSVVDLSPQPPLLPTHSAALCTLQIDPRCWLVEFTEHMPTAIGIAAKVANRHQ